MTPYDAFLLVSFGGPEREEDVMPFLRRVTAGRSVPEARLQQVAQHYYAAGGRSPINDQCRAFLQALRAELSPLALRLYWGNRNWHPFLEDTLVTMSAEGIRRAIALVTSAYGGYSGCRQYLEDIERARAAVGPRAPAVDKLRLFYNHPGWVGPWVTSVQRALSEATKEEGGATEVLFSAHSVPVAMPGASLYSAQVQETSSLVAEGAGLAPSQWRLVWQSRSGSPGSTWLGPDICDAVRGSAAGVVVVVPIGFVSEHMEVVHDLDVEAANAARDRGARFARAATVSTDPDFLAMVRELVQERSDPSLPRRALGRYGPWPDDCPAGHCLA
jgi:ferrochelatase